MKDIMDIFENFPTLESKNYILRNVRSTDYEDIYEIYKEKEVMIYQCGACHTTINESIKYINFINDGFNNKFFIRWAIENKFNHKILGLVALHHINSSSLNAQMGYILNKNYWQKHIMSESLKTIIDFLFNEFDLHRLEVSIHPENIASIKLAEKLGFKYEGLKKECVYNKSTLKYEDRIILGLIKL